jgi:GntR family transcriptional regulator, arabinose operon transcriptional repressor
MRRPPEASSTTSPDDPSLVDDVRKRIAELLDGGTYPPGTRLPPERTLAEQFGVNRLTVNKALLRFVDAGRLRRRVGSGTWVCEPQHNADLSVVDVYLPANERMDEGASAILGRPGVVEGVHDYFRNRPVRMAVSFFRDDAELVDRIERTADEAGAAQIIWYRPSPQSRAMIRGLRERGRTFCLIDTRDPEEDTHVVATDNFQGGLLATSTLGEAGRRRLAYLTMPTQQESLRERLAGARSGADRASARLTVHEIASAAEVPGLLDGWAASGMPDGIAASNDWIALDVLRGLRERGVVVPQDLSLIGYDDIEPGRWGAPALSTIAQDFYGIGFRAADVVDRCWRDAGGSCRAQYLGPKLVRRGTL